MVQHWEKIIIVIPLQFSLLSKYTINPVFWLLLKSSAFIPLCFWHTEEQLYSQNTESGTKTGAVMQPKSKLLPTCCHINSNNKNQDYRENPGGLTSRGDNSESERKKPIQMSTILYHKTERQTQWYPNTGCHRCRCSLMNSSKTHFSFHNFHCPGLLQSGCMRERQSPRMLLRILSRTSQLAMPPIKFVAWWAFLGVTWHWCEVHAALPHILQTTYHLTNHRSVLQSVSDPPGLPPSKLFHMYLMEFVVQPGNTVRGETERRVTLTATEELVSLKWLLNPLSSHKPKL